MVKLEIWEIVEEYRNNKWILLTLNATFLSLDPKEDNVSSPSRYILISLCNIIYKIISKIIANRRKLLLSLLISPEQTDYVEGRQIWMEFSSPRDNSLFKDHKETWNAPKARLI